MPFLSFESINFPGKFIRHKDFLGELTQVGSDDVEKKDATFEIFHSWFTWDHVVRLESVNFPAHVLRHQDFRIKLHPFTVPLFLPGHNFVETDEQRLLREDASFFLRHGLINPENTSFVSFESFNKPGRFIRHKDFHLFLEEVGSDDGARHDATFRLRPPFAPPPPDIVH